MARSVTNRQRIIDHGEVFTPPGLVNDMLDLVAHECERIDSRFLEPACGNGNFLAEVLRRKLLTVDQQNAKNNSRWERDAVLAVCSLYGIDLLADNIAACQDRLLGIVADAYEARHETNLPDAVHRAVEYILSKNIVQGDALSFRTADDQPIVLSEWSPINGTQIKRRDFRYDDLLKEADIKNKPLFSDMGEDVFIPTKVDEFPPCHYLNMADQEAGA